MTPLPLPQLIDRYELSREITAEYAYQLRYAVSRFDKFLARPSTSEDLSQDTINRWLLHELHSHEIGDRSRANCRRSILTLWRSVDAQFNRELVRKVKVPDRNPEAWTFDELSRVARAAEEIDGQLTNGIPRSLYMRSVLWFAYETGLRRSDIWRFDIASLNRDRVAAITQRKTSRVHVITVSDATLIDLRSINRLLIHRGDSHASTPLRWPQSISQFYFWMRRCRALASVDVASRNRSLQHVRRTGATQVDADGGRSDRFLGHSRPGLNTKSYIDQRLSSRAITPVAKRG